MTTPEPYAATDKSSFAYESTVRRWPQILTAIVNDLNAKDDAAKKVATAVQELIQEIKSDAKLSLLQDDGGSGIEGYNDDLSSHPRTWMTASWLFAECYLLRVLFAMSPLNDYDPFAKQKQDTFSASSVAVLKLGERIEAIVENADKDDLQTHQTHFVELAQTCLWGNATDLSLLTDLRLEDVAKLQTTSKDNEKNVLVNDLAKVWDYMQTLKNDRIDIILDNAGFELYVDLLFSDWLIAAGFAKEVILHPKNLPWFVSDVMPDDFDWLLSSLNDPAFFSESSSLHKMAARWSQYVKNGQWKLSFSQSTIGQKGPGDFWTSQYPYALMPAKAPELIEELQNSKLVIFKGDLNYRKLTSDAKWPRTTPFTTAIGDLNGRLPILSLRTCKADVVVGLSDGDEEQLNKVDSRWAVNGKYAVVSFSPRQS